MIGQISAFGFAPGLVELIIIGLISLLFLGIPAMVLAAIYFGRRQSGATAGYGRVPCPECGESIVAEAVKCRFCGTRFDEDGIEPTAERATATDE